MRLILIGKSMQQTRRQDAAATLALLSVFSLFAFLFNFAWEVLQTPFFVRMPAMSHWDGTIICLRATVGDVIIALVAFAAAAWWSKQFGWVLDPTAQATSVYLATGVLITIAFEWHAVYVAHRWAYSELMPIVPVLRVGLMPILQWLVLPLAILYFIRRHFTGGQADPASGGPR